MKSFFKLALVIMLSSVFISSASALSYALLKNPEGTVLEKVYFDENKTVKVLKINAYCSYQKFVHGNVCEIFLEKDTDVIFSSQTETSAVKTESEVVVLKPEVKEVKPILAVPKIVRLPKITETIKSGLRKSRGLAEIVEGNNRVTVQHGLVTTPSLEYCTAHLLGRRPFNTGNVFIESVDSEYLTIGIDYHVPANHSGTSAETNLPNKVKLSWRCE